MTNLNKKINPKREALINRSTHAREMCLLDPEEYPNINSAVIAQYLEENPDIKVFRTFREWKEEGRLILKGSHAFAVWAKPRKIITKEENKLQQDNPDEHYKFWPICYLFSDTQTKPILTVSK